MKSFFLRSCLIVFLFVSVLLFSPFCFAGVAFDSARQITNTPNIDDCNYVVSSYKNDMYAIWVEQGYFGMFNLIMDKSKDCGLNWGAFGGRGKQIASGMSATGYNSNCLFVKNGTIFVTYFSDRMYLIKSTDGGESFQEAGKFPADFMGIMSMDTTVNSTGTYIYSVAATMDALTMTKSVDGGATFSDTSALTIPAGPITHGMIFDLSIQASPDGKELYIFVIAAASIQDVTKNRLLFTKSLDGGTTFEPFKEICQNNIDPCQLSSAHNGQDMRTAVDIKGKIYVIWRAAEYYTNKGIVTLSESTDKGATFLHTRVTGENDSYVTGPSICVDDSSTNGYFKVCAAFYRYRAVYDPASKTYSNTDYRLYVAERTLNGKFAETLIYGPFRYPYIANYGESPAMCAGQDSKNVFIAWKDLSATSVDTKDTSVDLYGATYPAIGNKVTHEGGTLDFTVRAVNTDNTRSLTYSIYPGGDLDHSGTLSPGDVNKMMDLLWTQKGDPKWNGEADMSGDGFISPIDYLMVITLINNNQLGLPAGLSIDKNTGRFSWAPALKQSGSYRVIFNATNGISTASEMSTITVNTNQKPALSPIGNKVATAGMNLRFTVSGSDPDGDPLTYSMTGMPTGATINGTTGEFSWTPSASQGGFSFKATFKVSDKLDSATETITLKVNRKPILQPIGNRVTNINVNLKIQLLGYDLDGDKLNYSMTGLPANAVLNGTTGELNWRPTASQTGVYTPTFGVSDGIATASQIIGIEVNDPSVIADLNFANITYEEDAIVSGVSGSGISNGTSKNMFFCVYVRNTGNKDVTTSFPVDFYVDGRYISSQAITYLKYNTPQIKYDKLLIFKQILTKGAHAVKFVIDPQNVIRESNDNNNLATITAVVK